MLSRHIPVALRPSPLRLSYGNAEPEAQTSAVASGQLADAALQDYSDGNETSLAGEMALIAVGGVHVRSEQSFTAAQKHCSATPSPIT